MSSQEEVLTSVKSELQHAPSTRKAFAHTLLVRAIGFGVGIGNSVLVARGLGAEGRGHLSVYLTAAMFLSLLLGPFSASNTILLGRNPKLMRTLIYHSLTWTLLAVLSLLGLYWLAPPHFIKLVLDKTLPPWVWLLFIILSFQILAGGFQGLLLGRQDFYFSNYLSVINGAVMLGLNVIFIAWLNWDVTGAMLAFAITWMLSAAFAFWRLQVTEERQMNVGHFSLPLFQEGLTIGLRAIASNFPSLLMLRSDVFLLQYFCGSAPVGIYTVAVSVAEMVLIVGGALNTIAFAKAASQQGIEASVIRSAKFSLIASLGFWALLSLTGRWLFPLAYGREFAAAVAPCLIVMIGICAWNFGTPLMGYVVGKASYPLSYLIAVFGGFIINLACNVILIPRYGSLGAAWATAIAYVATALIGLRVFSRMTGTRMLIVLRPDRDDLNVILNLIRQNRYFALKFRSEKMSRVFSQFN